MNGYDFHGTIFPGDGSIGLIFRCLKSHSRLWITYDILEGGDELSRSMLTGNTKDISCEAIGHDDFANCLTPDFEEKP